MLCPGAANVNEKEGTGTRLQNALQSCAHLKAAGLTEAWARAQVPTIFAGEGARASKKGQGSMPFVTMLNRASLPSASIAHPRV